jgi:hypothetical protein
MALLNRTLIASMLALSHELRTNPPHERMKPKQRFDQRVRARS